MGILLAAPAAEGFLQGLRGLLGGRADELDLDADGAHFAPRVVQDRGLVEIDVRSRGAACAIGVNPLGYGRGWQRSVGGFYERRPGGPPRRAVWLSDGGLRVPARLKARAWTCIAPDSPQRAAWLAELRATLVPRAGRWCYEPRPDRPDHRPTSS